MPSAIIPQSNGTHSAKESLGDVLHIIDSRTREHYTIDIHQNAINASDLKAIKAPKDEKHPEYQTEQGLRVYDPGYSNTLVSESKITYMQVSLRSPPKPRFA
jgi:citrate synthase